MGYDHFPFRICWVESAKELLLNTFKMELLKLYCCCLLFAVEYIFTKQYFFSHIWGKYAAFLRNPLKFSHAEVLK